MPKILPFFKLMHQQGASDIHFVSGSPPLLRIHGDIQKIKYNILNNDTLYGLIKEITPPEVLKEFDEVGDVDFAYEIPGISRYRANLFKQKNGLSAVFRAIPEEIMTIADLKLPPIASKLAMLPNGLVLVTGPTGSGKSTSLAAMINHANLNRSDHILTIEDPIEFVHKSQKCIINHRQVKIHTISFASALRGALREDPDIILVGELRDLETIELALEAAATGHLVFGTLHTKSAPQTIDRIVDVFPADKQSKIRTTLAESLKAVISQNLFKKAAGKGRIGCFEVLVVSSAIANLIREGKTFQIPGFIQTGKKFGMMQMDDSIHELLQKKEITPEEAYSKSIEKEKFAKFLSKAPDIFI